jgi:hypothetical protein
MSRPGTRSCVALASALLGWLAAVPPGATPVAHNGYQVTPFATLPGARAVAVVPEGACLPAGVYVGVADELGAPGPVLFAFDPGGQPLASFPPLLPSPGVLGVRDLLPGPHAPGGWPEGLYATVRACDLGTSQGKAMRVCARTWEDVFQPPCPPLDEPQEMSWGVDFGRAGSDFEPYLFFLDENCDWGEVRCSEGIGAGIDPPGCPREDPDVLLQYGAIDFPPPSGPFPPGLYAAGVHRRCPSCDPTCEPVCGHPLVFRLDWPLGSAPGNGFATLPAGLGYAAYMRFAPGTGCFGGDLYVATAPSPGPCPPPGDSATVWRVDPSGNATLVLSDLGSRGAQLAFSTDGNAMYVTSPGEGRVFLVTADGVGGVTCAEGNGDIYCLWPPSHRYHCFDADDFAPWVKDSCSPAPSAWRFVDCASDQPDDAPGVGDGQTTHDCVLAPDGQGFCVRAERDGTRPEGRRYAVTIVADADCGAASAPTSLGFVHVPHDQSPGQDCLVPNGPR